MQHVVRGVFPVAVVVAAWLLIGISGACAQESSEAKTTVDLYGFAMLDMGYDSGQNDPDWFDVMRPTKLPWYEDQYGKDGNFYAGVRQSRFGVKAFIPTSAGEVKTIFEFELFGVGVDAGQTTFRLRHAWGELGQFGAGQTWSPFMDPDVFPNSVEYWGPSGMVFFRNVQLRWTPMAGDDTFMVALERPGASGDEGKYDEVIEPGRIDGRFPLPDLSARYRMTRPWGHLQIAGILREIKWDDMAPGAYDLSGSGTGWGVNLSTNLKFGDDVLRGSVVYGEGIENYMNDATVDAGLTDDPTNPVELLPLMGVVAFLDHKWNDKWTTTIGYSMVDIDNSDGQTSDAFATGQYALVNFMYYPAPNVMLGPELQWGSRENKLDGGIDPDGNLVESFDDFRIQFSARYSFKHTMGGAK
jgi:hypothetical protein